jgi:hypothetical protein
MTASVCGLVVRVLDPGSIPGTTRFSGGGKKKKKKRKEKEKKKKKENK